MANAAGASPSPSPWRRRLKRAGVAIAIGAPTSLLLLWLAVHQFPWLGPALADGLRRVIGTDNVSRLEDFVYGIEDRFNRWWRSDEAPKTYWEVPTASASASARPPPNVDDAPDAAPPVPPFRPQDVGPMHKALAAKGDGVWVPVADPVRGGAPILMHKTLIHPDRKRPWAELFVVALDLRHIQLHSVAGASEPRASTVEGRKYERKALIPSQHRASLLAGFNGGFKAQHGRWGMNIDGVTLVSPRKYGCTLGKLPSGHLLLEPWKDLSDELRSSLTWWRQTPPCMFLKGKRNGGLWDPDAKGWGAALDGATVIRRSAIGMDRARTVLFVGVSNHTSAQAIANGMKHAGAIDVAQLDVNWPFPRFVTFPRQDGRRITKSLFEGFEVDEDDYLRTRVPRDFFYVVRTDAVQ